MKTDFKKEQQKDAEYYELLSKRIRDFAKEAVYHGFKIVRAIRKLMENLDYITGMNLV